eukprot:CAMPEP_0184707364 /NCGR_PEP_ID=MMETSP0313-20130426/37234_1 /TAXON_ID=2792 /ORGANISM="Porphyridium aerugineum, Strain SAG 1380-2" /LENGTH=540 /DNA_ID=CAMNT_0027168939 /DNA_START=170 /DNA_END=1792 /DNA_ORIENTATION=-
MTELESIDELIDDEFDFAPDQLVDDKEFMVASRNSPNRRQIKSIVDDVVVVRSPRNQSGPPPSSSRFYCTSRFASPLPDTIQPLSMRFVPMPPISRASKAFSPRSSIRAHEAVENSRPVQWVSMSDCSLVHEPVVKIIPYNHGDAGSDLLTLYHNGIKHEIQDIYHMLACLVKRKNSLGIDDFGELDSWFDLFCQFLNWYMQFEETQLIPFILQAATPWNKLLDAYESELRACKKQLIEQRVTTAHDCLESILEEGFVNMDAWIHSNSSNGNRSNDDDEDDEDDDPLVCQTTAIERLVEFIYKVDSMVESILEYLFYEEGLFLPLLSSCIDISDKMRFEAEVFQTLHSVGVDGHLYFLILLRAVQVYESIIVADQLEQYYLNQYISFSPKNRQLSKVFPQSKELWKKNHFNIVMKLVCWNMESQCALFMESTLVARESPVAHDPEIFDTNDKRVYDHDDHNDGGDNDDDDDDDEHDCEPRSLLMRRAPSQIFLRSPLSSNVSPLRRSASVNPSPRRTSSISSRLSMSIQKIGLKKILVGT